MRRFSYTSPHFEGMLIFTYDANNCLTIFEHQAKMTDAQDLHLSRNFPIRLKLLEGMSTKGTLLEITDLTFEKFYNEYAYKKDKKAASDQWDKLNDSEKVRALAYINRYNSFLIKSGTAKKYPVRYLSKRVWEDED